MTDEPDTPGSGDGPEAEPFEEVVAGVLDDIDAAYDDYERGYTDADATLSVVMSHVERLREAGE